ncbi:hypothetical protein Y1Q_0024424 [Alligator mississippiensis]|uniref:Uncharacterized protein n=1 Tax=Alligator mississippiensis TaxID=8496 RepID=A0A151ND37_ALLMI|nr:hypothetical protein Y1Q_0024424 [Alligator mississippiensis]
MRSPIRKAAYQTHYMLLSACPEEYVSFLLCIARRDEKSSFPNVMGLNSFDGAAAEYPDLAALLCVEQGNLAEKRSLKDPPSLPTGFSFSRGTVWRRCC